MIYHRHQGSDVRGNLPGYELQRKGKRAIRDCAQEVLLGDQHSGHIHQGPWISAHHPPHEGQAPPVRRGPPAGSWEPSLQRAEDQAWEE